jgi:hypothetical protein
MEGQGQSCQPFLNSAAGMYICIQETGMANNTALSKIVAEVELLEYDERLRLLEALVSSLRRMSEKSAVRRSGDDLSGLLGIWRDRDIDLGKLRAAAWSRA